jgi:tetratricopeptide (TPR) repeat protein
VGEDALIDKALAAVREGEPEDARLALVEALREHPGRTDLVHALAVIQLQLGLPEQALALMAEAEKLARTRAEPSDVAILPQLLLVRGAAHEDLYQAAEAEAAYRQILQDDPAHPLATQGLGHLLLAWGRTEDGLAMLQSAIDAGADDPDFLAASTSLIEAIRHFISEDVHPKNFIEAHRGSYVAFFDHHADEMAEKGWIAEAARMLRREDGEMVAIIPEGARPYAAMRVDLVDPSTGKAGLVGDQPMIVALAGHEALAHAPLVSDWPQQPFPVWVSSQCPWDQLPIAIRFDAGDPIAQADPTIGDWYTAGYEGNFGSTDRGRFHYISDPQALDERTVLFHVDCGRAEHLAIEDLIKRLSVLHCQHPIASLLIGRGFVPEQP